MKRWTLAALVAAVLAGATATSYPGEFRLGGNISYLVPSSPDFSNEFGYGARGKYKFNDTLGFEIGGDFFQLSVEELVTMPYSAAPGPIYYKETNRIFPAYFTMLIFSPRVTQEGRAYLGVGAGYFFTRTVIEGNYDAINPDSGQTYPITITGDVRGGASFHVGAGVDFDLGSQIFLNVDARWVYTGVKREITHSNPEKGSLTIADDPLFNNWQLRAGLEYKF